VPDSVNHYEMLTKLIDRNSRWSEVADAKAGVVLVFATTILKILVGDPVKAVPKIAGALPSDLNALTVLFTLAFIVCFAVSIWGGVLAISESLRALRPRITRQAPAGLVFFGDIAARPAHDYIEHALLIEKDALNRDLAEQVHTTADISAIKHRHVHSAIFGIYILIVGSLPLYVLTLLVP
jgi:hypothetical protein